MESKILLGSPTFKNMKYCQDKFLDRIKNLTYPSYDILIIDNSKDKSYFNELNKIKGLKVIHDSSDEEKSIFRLISSRNKILKYAIKNNYTHILMLDSDVIPPENIIEELIKHDKNIISGVYYNYFNVSKKRKFLPVAWKNFTQEEIIEIKTKYPHIKIEDLKRHLTQEEVDSNKVHKVSIPSAGCMLIKRNVFEKVKYGKFKKGYGADDDIYFITHAKKLGFEPYCNTKVKCDHLVIDKYVKDEKGNLIHSSFRDVVKQ